MARQKHSNIREGIIARVRPRPGHSHQGILVRGAWHVPCALGRSALTARKREGDGATPLGRWQLRRVFYRPDRVARPRTALPVRALHPDDGWCEDPSDRNYNRLVRLPYETSTESMWREDHLYDVVVVLGYNDVPRRKGRGSAIFMHLARPGYAPTEGCVALKRRDLLRLLAYCRPGSALDIRKFG